MIKFWKSAAKGKSGFPVRPPEPAKETHVREKLDKPLVLETILEDELKDSEILFHKKSRLSPSLKYVLSEDQSRKHFAHFMQSICKILILRCWLELENFRTSILNSSNSSKNFENSKLCRTKSLNLDWSSQEKTHGLLLGDYGKLHDTITSDTSTNSCHNLADNDFLLECNSGHSISNPTEAAINIFKKYVALEAPNKLELSDETRKLVISNICQPLGVNEDCFKPVQEVLFHQMENVYFDQFQRSPFYAKAQLDVITGGNLNLGDIVHNETVLFYFTEYLEQESASILLEYFMAVMHFRENMLSSGHCSPEQSQQDAIIIYEKYFSLQATNPVGFPADVRLKVESEICREGGPLYSCFDLPSLIVFKTLNLHLKSFLDSEIYFRYLSEIINSVDQMMSNCRSQSDCSSEFSISTQNTLLAMGDPVFQRKKRNHSVPDMTIDHYQLYNADSLWQRKRQDGLSLGRVNSLGRFESKFEPDPDKKEKSVLKKMVSRFVPSIPNKVEEEMAWQIAHMIVKDVTDLTMAPPDNERDDSS